MEIEKKLSLLQYIYSASLAETVNSYGRMNVLDGIVGKRKEMQAQSAPVLNQQLCIKNVEDVFCNLSELFGCANWTVEKTNGGYTAVATACRLCSLSRKMGGADPCHGWCLDPMFAMISAASGISGENITVESTLMDGCCCKVLIKDKD